MLQRIQATINTFLNDERLMANLIGLHIVVGLALLFVYILRKTLKHGGENVARMTGLHWMEGMGKEATASLRSLLSWIAIGAVLGAAVFTTVYHSQGRDIRVDARDIISHFSSEQLTNTGVLLGKVVAIIVGVGLGFSVLRRTRRYLESQAYRHLPRHVPEETQAVETKQVWSGMRIVDQPESAAPTAEQALNHEDRVRRWFDLFERFGAAMLIIAGMWAVGKLFQLQSLDYFAKNAAVLLTILGAARLLMLGSGWIVAVVRLVGESQFRSVSSRRYWDQASRLLPFGQRCLEAVIAVAAAHIAFVVYLELGVDNQLGINVVKCIGIFFGARCFVELSSVMINEILGLYDDTKENDQRAQTLAPLLHSVGKYAIFILAAAFILNTLFKDQATPIFASMGIVGLFAGMGAQSLVTDVVSGFFILFEGQFLVGDIVQIGDVAGKVEAVNIRTTQVRDESGKLTFIPNGQIKNVTNYSKGWVNAVVDVKVPTSANLELVMADMAEAGRRLRQSRREVLGETQVKGLVDLTPGDMVIRAITKVEPGAHNTMQREYRRLLKEVMDRNRSMADSHAA